MFYIKEFETTAQYNAYTADTANFITPNVSLCNDNPADLHYNPYDPYNGHEYIEIGGVKWATMNIGAESETDYGLYFQWGDTQGYTSEQCGSGEGQKYFMPTDYIYWTGDTGDGSSGLTKYNSTDGKTVLDPSDDAAKVIWGGNWRMPTPEEFQALGNATIFIDSSGKKIGEYGNKFITLSGVTGIYLQDKTDSNKRLFFPAAGYCRDGSLQHNGEYCNYWSCSLDSKRVLYAYCMHIDSYHYDVLGYWFYNSFIGSSVRPVFGV